MYDDIVNELRKISDEETKILNENSNEILKTEEHLGDKIIKISRLKRFISRNIQRENYACLIYMIRGRSKHNVDGEIITLKTNELLLVNNQVNHRIEVLLENDIAIQISIDEKFIDHCILKSDVLISFLLKIMFDDEQNLKFIRFNICDIKPVHNILESMTYTYINKIQMSEHSDYFYLNLLFEHLKNEYTKLKYSSNAKDVRLIIMVMKYIEDNLRDGELNQIADELIITPYTLSKRIKKLTGYNFKEILQNKKINTAKNLLDNTDLPIFEISNIIGYENMSYFQKIFKQKFGVSPSKYRKNKREN